MLRPLPLGLLVQLTGWLGAEVRGHQPQGDDEARDRGRDAVIHKNFQGHIGAVNCHHNYVQAEHHIGEDVYITRKGSVSAKAGQLGIMGARSYNVRGEGNADAFESFSHAAGPRDEPQRSEASLYAG